MTARLAAFRAELVRNGWAARNPTEVEAKVEELSGIESLKKELSTRHLK